MKKYVTLFGVLLLTTTLVQAQFKLPKALLAFHGLYAAPASYAVKDSFQYGIGAEAEVGFGIGKTMITGSVGYMNYSPKNSSSNSLSIVPVRVGVRQYLLAGLFLNGSFGVGFQNFTKASNAFIGQPSVGDAYKSALDNSTNMIYEAGAGFKLVGIEGVINYTGWKNGSADGWNSGILFKLGYTIKL